MKAPVPDTPQGEYRIPSAGVHPVCYETFVYLGMQDAGSYAGEPLGLKAQCWIRFAVMDEFTDGEHPRPLTVHMFPMTFSMHEKAKLRLTIEQSFGKKFPDDRTAGDFDMRNLLGKMCQASIVHTTKGENTYAAIQALMPLPQGSPKPSPPETIYYDPDNQEQFDKLPQWIRKKLNTEGSQRKEYNPIQSGDYTGRDFENQPPNEDKTGMVPDYDDDIPF